MIVLILLYCSIAKVSLIQESEHTILSRIRYPETLPESATIFGLKDDRRKVKFILGIPSFERPLKANYLNSTISRVFESLSESEIKKVLIIIYLNDKSPRLIKERADKLHNSYKTYINSGVLKIIKAPRNIYPNLNYTSIFRTFENTPGQVEWRSKICLDFAYLMSYARSENLAEYFINLEDDIIPGTKHFVDKTLEFIKTNTGQHWSSLQLSDFMSIGRLYRTSELNKIVEFILISYTRMPVDWLMTEYDRIQLANHYKIFRIKPSLFLHNGEISSKGIFTEKEQKQANQKFDMYKVKNPTAK